MMLFMLIALISVLGSGLLGIIGVLLHYLLRQNAQRASEHKEFMAAIAKQGDRIVELHDRVVELHLQAMAAVAALSERTASLEAKAG